MVAVATGWPLRIKSVGFSEAEPSTSTSTIQIERIPGLAIENWAT